MVSEYEPCERCGSETRKNFDILTCTNVRCLHMQPNLEWNRRPDPIESPAKNERTITYEETEHIKRLIADLRYVQKWDAPMLFNLAQAAQVEGRKIQKMSRVKEKSGFSHK